MGSDFHGDEEPNGSKAMTLILRLSTMALALTSAVLMATASECTIFEPRGAKITITYKDFPPFVYLVGFNISATVLEGLGIYLQQVVGWGGSDDDDDEAPKLAKFLFVLVDVLVPALLNLATGAVFSAVVAYGPKISACAVTTGRFCEQVHRSKFLSFGASISAVLTAAVKDVRLPFNVWPVSSDDGC